MCIHCESELGIWIPNPFRILDIVNACGVASYNEYSEQVGNQMEMDVLVGAWKARIGS